MKYRTLGQGLKVSAIGIGCMPMIRDGNINYGAADDDVSTRTIYEAIDLGITFFDTAEMYGPFSNEGLVGAAIKGRRDGLIIATKFAMRWNGNHAGRGRWQPRECPTRLRGIAEATWHRHDRPVLPASRRSERADRGNGRRYG